MGLVECAKGDEGFVCVDRKKATEVRMKGDVTWEGESSCRKTKEGKVHKGFERIAFRVDIALRLPVPGKANVRPPS